MARPDRPRRTPKPTRNKTKLARRQAHVDAAALGSIEPVDPARGHRVDGSPRAGAGQAYVTRTGTVYHLGWCATVAAQWDQRKPLFVVDVATVGGRRPCRTCLDEGPLTD